jgi:hypothetical protein
MTKMPMAGHDLRAGFSNGDGMEKRKDIAGFGVTKPLTLCCDLN